MTMSAFKGPMFRRENPRKLYEYEVGRFDDGSVSGFPGFVRYWRADEIGILRLSWELHCRSEGS